MPVLNPLRPVSSSRLYVIVAVESIVYRGSTSRANLEFSVALGRSESHEKHTSHEQSSIHCRSMNLHELEDKIDRLSIRKQLEALDKTLSESKKKLEISTVLWERIMAAEGLLNAEEMKLFDAAADKLIDIRSLVGCRQKKRRRK